MKFLYLIRHAKSSWNIPDQNDYDRPLNKRGKKDAQDMGQRLASRGVSFDVLVSSPAKRARATARRIAKEVHYPKKDIVFYKSLYLTDIESYTEIVQAFFTQVETLALVGHNQTITAFAEYLTGDTLGNIPTAGIVAIEFEDTNDLRCPGVGTKLFFDFPKNIINLSLPCL